MARAFGASYIAGDQAARPFLPLNFHTPEARTKATRHAASLGCAPEVVSLLRTQQAQWGPTTPALEAHLNALVEGNTAVVVTGQQVGLFLGPLYTFYKAASAIAIAKSLAAASGCQVVPVFWLQVEDHDLPEIASTALPCTQDDPEVLAYPASHEHRASVAHHQFGEEIGGLCGQLEEALGDMPHGAESLALWRDHYREGATPGEAFAGVLARLFRDEGLLILDPRTPEFAALAAPLHREAMAQATPLREALVAREAALSDAGYKVQIPTRPDTCLSFFHPDGPTGPRYRLMQQGDGFGLAGHSATYTHEALEARLQEAPMCWSTSALLRPLLQDTLLPTAAYVGGPGELSYFGQLSPVYDHFARTMPLLAPRARFVLLEAAAQKALARLDIDVDALSQTDDELLAQLSLVDLPGPGPEAFQTHLLDPLAMGIALLGDEIVQLDPNLAKALEKTHHHMASAIEKLSKKVQNVRLQRDQQRVQQLRGVRQRLLPTGKPQERVFGLPYFFARYGIQALKDAVFAAIQPFDPTRGEIPLPHEKEAG